MAGSEPVQYFGSHWMPCRARPSFLPSAAVRSGTRGPTLAPGAVAPSSAKAYETLRWSCLAHPLTDADCQYVTHELPEVTPRSLRALTVSRRHPAPLLPPCLPGVPATHTVHVCTPTACNNLELRQCSSGPPGPAAHACPLPTCAPTRRSARASLSCCTWLWASCTASAALLCRWLLCPPTLPQVPA